MNLPTEDQGADACDTVWWLEWWWKASMQKPQMLFLIGIVFNFLDQIYPLKTCQCVWILFPWARPTVFAMELFYEDSWKTCWSSCKILCGQMIPWSWRNKKPVRVCDTMDCGLDYLELLSTYEQNFSKLTALLVDSFMDSLFLHYMAVHFSS